jgi:hypothetical protein
MLRLRQEEPSRDPSKDLARGLLRVQVAFTLPSPGPFQQTGVVPNERDGAIVVTKPCSRWTAPTPFYVTNQRDAQQMFCAEGIPIIRTPVRAPTLARSRRAPGRSDPERRHAH